MRERPKQSTRHNRAERNNPDRRRLLENEEIAIGAQAGAAVEKQELLAERMCEQKKEKRKKEERRQRRKKKKKESIYYSQKIIFRQEFTTYLRELVLPSATTSERTLGGRCKSNWRSMPAI